MKKNLFFLLLFLVAGFQSYSQDFSNKGKDFWVGYGYHQIMTAGNLQQMVLYFATDQVTNITISIPGNGYTQTLTSSAVPGVMTSLPIPKLGTQDVRLLSESTSPENKGIHITSDKPIVAYAHIYNSSVSGATILFPTPTLGREYYSINYTNVSNTNDANCFFYVLASDTGTTTVEITPSAATINHAAGIPFTVNLTQGQIFNLLGYFDNSTNKGVDLTGSKIKSIASGNGGCKRIAVFSGSGRIGISCLNSSSSSDNYMVQAFPQTAWGKKYLTSSTGGQMTFDIYRICVSNPAAVVKVNGAPIAVPLQGNFYYELPLTNQPQKIESDLPITVAQYITSQSRCGNGLPGDPEVIYLSPVEQNIDKVQWNATNNYKITESFYNVIIPNSGTAISSFKLDGITVPPSAFAVHPQEPNFSYLTQSVATGQSHLIQSDSGFNAIAYGFGPAESYGYNAGTNVKDLYQQISTATEYGIGTSASVCTGTPFKFKISLPYQPDSLYLNFLGATNAPNPPFSNTTLIPPPNGYDSTTIINGKTIYWYSFPIQYNFNNVGVYPIRITAFAPASAGGCGSIQDIDFDLEVSGPPVVNFTSTSPKCFGQTLQFNDMTTSAKPTYRWSWDFGDPGSGANNTSSLKNPTHDFSAPGTYNVSFSTITTAGCVGNTITKQVVISKFPTAVIAGTATVCLNSAGTMVTFTGANGIAPYTFNYTLNGVPQTPLASTGNTATITVPTNNTGVFNYTITSVSDASPAVCSSVATGSAIVTVNLAPSATIAGTSAVCQNATAPSITFTGSNGATPYTFTYSINGGPAQMVTTTGTNNSIAVAAPTGTSGIFTYTLSSVKESSSTSCNFVFNPAPVATITVKELPIATITGSTSVCLNAASPLVTFTGANGTAPYTFQYTLNGVAQTPLVSAGNVVTQNVPTNIAGTFIYQLVSVQDASSTSCSQSQNGKATITIFPQPVPDFTFSIPSCETEAIIFNSSSSTAGAGTITNYSWNFGDASSGAANTSSLANPTHTFTAAGTYNVTLNISTSNNCNSGTTTKAVIITPKPKPGFILPAVCLLDPFAQFTDTSKIGAPGTITGWLWNFGDPASGALNISTVQNARHKYSAVGTYNVQLTVTSNTGCTNTITQQLSVNGGNPVSNFITQNTSNCANQLVGIINKSTITSGIITRLEIYWDNSGAPTSFDFDDSPLFDKVYQHKYPDFQSPLIKTYAVRVRAFSGGICFSDKIVPVTVNASPKVQFNPIPNACYNQPGFQITQAAEIGGVPGTGVFSGPGISPTGIFNPAGQPIGLPLTIKYKYTSTAGGCIDSASQTLTLRDTATAKFTFIQPVCDGVAASFTDVSSAPAGIILQNTVWDFGDGSASENHAPGSTFTHRFPAPGSYQVKMYNTSTNTCISTTNQQTVIVRPIPRPSFTFDKTDYCLPNALVQFNSSSSTISDATQSTFKYLWYFGDPASGSANTSTLANPSHSYATAGTYTISLQITSAAGCVHDTSLVLKGLHPQPFAAFSFAMPTLCTDQDAVFIDKSTGADGTITKWNWNFGDGSGTSSMQTPPPYRYKSKGSYDVKLEVTNSFGCIKDTTKTITVYPYPIVDAGNAIYVLEGGSATLKPTVTAIQPQYLWSWNVSAPAGYLDNPRIMNPITAPLTDVLYTLTVTGSGGCTSSDTVFVKVLKTPAIPNTFSPNNDGINDFWVIKYLDTYPNANVQVFNRTGQIVFKSKGYAKPWDGNLNGKSLPVDTYYYVIEPENGRAPITGYVTIVK